MDVIEPGTHGSTFGGNALGCRVAIEALKTLQEEKVIENARLMGEKLRLCLCDLPKDIVCEVRGMGLLNALVFNDGNVSYSAIKTITLCYLGFSFKFQTNFVFECKALKALKIKNSVDLFLFTTSPSFPTFLAYLAASQNPNVFYSFIPGINACDICLDMMHHGLLVKTAKTNIIRLCPPLVIGEKDIVKAASIIRHCIENSRGNCTIGNQNIPLRPLNEKARDKFSKCKELIKKAKPC